MQEGDEFRSKINQAKSAASSHRSSGFRAKGSLGSRQGLYSIDTIRVGLGFRVVHASSHWGGDVKVSLCA